MNSTPAQTAKNTPIKYRPRGALFTKAEQKFLVALRHISGDNFHVFGKVRVSDIIVPAVNKFEKASGWHWLFSQVSQKHVDFVITDQQLNFICAVELNDKSHDKEDRQKRDAFLEEAFISADMALVWVNVDSQYLSQELANQIADVVSTRSHAKAVVGRLMD
jgi:hypothetical protein